MLAKSYRGTLGPLPLSISLIADTAWPVIYGDIFDVDFVSTKERSRGERVFRNCEEAACDAFGIVDKKRGNAAAASSKGKYSRSPVIS